MRLFHSICTLIVLASSISSHNGIASHVSMRRDFPLWALTGDISLILGYHTLQDLWFQHIWAMAMDGAVPKPLNMICSLEPIGEHEHKLGQILLTRQPYLLGRYMKDILDLDDMSESAADAPPGCQLAPRTWKGRSMKMQLVFRVTDQVVACMPSKCSLLCLADKNSLRLGEMVRQLNPPVSNKWRLAPRQGSPLVEPYRGVVIEPYPWKLFFGVESAANKRKE